MSDHADSGGARRELGLRSRCRGLQPHHSSKVVRPYDHIPHTKNRTLLAFRASHRLGSRRVMHASIEAEWATAELGDVRRVRRAQLIGGRWAASPGASFPDMVDGDAELEGLYEFVENEKVDPRELLASHARASRDRVVAAGLGTTVLVVHDTTTMEFSGESVRHDVGWVSREKQGFFAHIALALSADGSARPFGIVGLSTFHRERPLPMKDREQKNHDGKISALDPERESLRWGLLVDETSRLFHGHAIPIHVTDREADSYEYLSGRVRQNQRFVARARELDRPVTIAGDEPPTRSKLHLVAERAVPIAERDVTLSRRPRSPLPTARKRHPARKQRVARLQFAAERVRIARPSHLPESMPAFIDLNVVHVREPASPDDAEPVEWLLLTSEPIETAEDILRVVDHYRARWTIEEFNKAIKTGCMYESRQLESLHGLLIALALCIPVAWQILLLRHQSRTDPDATASTVVSETRLATLRTIARRPLPTSPTALDVYLAIAALGGHLKRNGPPGWQTLRCGLDRLLFAEAAFEARDREPRARAGRSAE